MLRNIGSQGGTLRPLSVPFLLRTSGKSHSQAGSTTVRVQSRLVKTEEFSTGSFWEKYVSEYMLLVDICVLDIFSWLNRASI